MAKLKEILNEQCSGQKESNKHLWELVKEPLLALRTNDQMIIRLLTLKCPGCDQEIIVRSAYRK